MFFCWAERPTPQSGACSRNDTLIILFQMSHLCIVHLESIINVFLLVCFSLLKRSLVQSNNSVRFLCYLLQKKRIADAESWMRRMRNWVLMRPTEAGLGSIVISSATSGSPERQNFPELGCLVLSLESRASLRVKSLLRPPFFPLHFHIFWFFVWGNTKATLRLHCVLKIIVSDAHMLQRFSQC